MPDANNSSKRFSHVGFFLLILLLLAPSLSALGVSPAKTTLDLPLGATTTRELLIINSESRDLHLTLFATGELASTITLAKKTLDLPAGQSAVVTYTLRIPSSVDHVGDLTGSIIAKELPPPSVTGRTNEVAIKALLGVASLIQVHVPYRGRVLEGSLFIPTVAPFDDVAFLAQARNVGDASLSPVSVTLAVYDLEDQKLTTLTSEKQTLAPGKSSTFPLVWNPHIRYGDYQAVVTFLYSGKTQELRTDFTIGSFAVDLADLRIEDFVYSSQAKLIATLQNTQETAAKVDTLLTLKNEQAGYSLTFPKQTTTVQGKSQQELSFLWQLAQVPLGRYDGTMTLTVEGVAATRHFSILLTEEGISSSFTPSNALTGKTIYLPPTPDDGILFSSSSWIVTLVVLLVLGHIIYFSWRFLRTAPKKKLPPQHPKKRNR